MALLADYERPLACLPRRCIRDNLERDMGQRFLHGLELALATMLGTAVLLAIAVITNNLGPNRYPIYWWK